MMLMLMKFALEVFALALGSSGRSKDGNRRAGDVSCSSSGDSTTTTCRRFIFTYYFHANRFVSPIQYLFGFAFLFSPTIIGLVVFQENAWKGWGGGGGVNGVKGNGM